MPVPVIPVAQMPAWKNASRAAGKNVRLAQVSCLLLATAAFATEPAFNCYEPIPGGWELRLQDGVTAR
jgi:hypothetical protein